MKKEIIYNKLVRDNILEIISCNNQKSSYHIATDEEYKNKLLEKLQEEISEFIIDKNEEELADIFEVIEHIITALNFNKEIIFSKVENYKSKIYDKNENLIFSTTYINRKLEAESQVDETLVKMTYNFDDNNFNKGTVNLYMNNKLFATVRIKNSIQDGEMKMFYPNGKVMGSSTFKNGK